MNTIKKYIPILLVLILASCGKDFLKKEPHVFTDAAFWQTAAQAEAALAGVYTPLQGEEALGGEDWCGFECFSDNAYMNDNGYGDYISMTEFRATQNNMTGDLCGLSYGEYYQTIKRATDVLNNVPKITMDAAQQKRILGEANFLLSFAYYQLCIRYGGLPIYSSTDPTAALTRKTEAETWAVIESGLKEATTQLSQSHDEGRPGLGAAWGMLAKVYAHEAKWAEAKNAAEQVTGASLTPNYADVFTIPHENDTELLWGLGARLGEYPITPVLMLPNNVWNGRHEEPIGEGWRLVSATLAFYNSYQPGDLRKAATVAKRYADVITYNGATDTLQAPNNQSPVVCVKYNAPYKDQYTGWAAGLNVPALRYADVLLIHAEATMMLNGGGPANRTVGVAAAAQSFNLVRNRAGLPSIAAPTFNDLMYERRMELAFEGGDRHTDLIRWGLAEEVYNALPAEGGYKPKRTYVQATNRVMPILQTEIDNSGGSIKQNPGYAGGK